MRPLFAIAPLALALALMGPSSQATTPISSWSQAFIDWVFGQDATPPKPAAPAVTDALNAPFEAR